MSNPTTTKAFGPVINRIADVMAHSERYSFHGTSRLAEDAGVSSTSVSRLIHGETNPTFLMVARITGAIEKELGHPVDPRNLVGEGGVFLTRSVCGVVGCRGCFPNGAHDEYNVLRPEFRGIDPGAWVTSQYPSGFVQKGGL